MKVEYVVDEEETTTITAIGEGDICGNCKKTMCEDRCDAMSWCGEFEASQGEGK